VTSARSPGQEDQTALRAYEIDREGQQRLDESAGFYLARDRPLRREYVFEADRRIAGGVVVLKAITSLTANLNWTRPN
jgi:hypothetical protein